MKKKVNRASATLRSYPLRKIAAREEHLSYWLSIFGREKAYGSPHPIPMSSQGPSHGLDNDAICQH